jgi:hypothetical protein
MKGRGTAIMEEVQPEPQMAQYWKEYFATVLKGSIKIWISIGAVRGAAISWYQYTNKTGCLRFACRHRNRPDDYDPTHAHTFIRSHPRRVPVHVRHGSSSRRFSQLQHEPGSL